MRRPKQALLASLQERGFDESFVTPFEAGATVRCSQCEALAINGVPCHETGCPNTVPECRDCGGLDPDGLCCTDSDPWQDSAEQEAE